MPYNVEPREMRFAPGAEAALKLFACLGMPLIVVTNQPGVAFRRFRPAALDKVATQLRHMFRSCGAVLAGFYYCPHHPKGDEAQYRKVCECRKPRAGMLIEAAAAHGVDLTHSWMIGDILDDVEAGMRAGCRTILVGANNEIISNRSPLRIPHYMARDLEEAARDVARPVCARITSVSAGSSLYRRCGAATA